MYEFMLVYNLLKGFEVYNTKLSNHSTSVNRSDKNNFKLIINNHVKYYISKFSFDKITKYYL